VFQQSIHQLFSHLPSHHLFFHQRQDKEEIRISLCDSEEEPIAFEDEVHLPTQGKTWY
jgi:hypothetical protein